MTMRNDDWDTFQQHPLLVLQGTISAAQEDTSPSAAGLAAARPNEEDHTGVEHEDRVVLPAPNSPFLNEGPTNENQELRQGDVGELNSNDIVNEGVPENPTVAATHPVDTGNGSLGSGSTSSSTRRRNEELERENAELRRLLQEASQQPSETPENLEILISPTSSLGTESTSSSTRQRNEELQQLLEEARRELDDSHDRIRWFELNASQRNAVEEHLGREGENQEGRPIVYAFDGMEGSAPSMENPREILGMKGSATTTKKAWWKSWWFIGGVVILVVVTGGVLYYAGAFSAGAAAASGATAAEASAVGATAAGTTATAAATTTAGGATAETAAASAAAAGTGAGAAAGAGAAETVTAGAATVLGAAAVLSSSKED